MRRIVAVSSTTIALALLAISMGCGDGIGSQDIAEVRAQRGQNAERPGSAGLGVTRPLENGRQSEPTSLVLRSSGQSDLRVERAALRNTPDSLIVRGAESDQECTFSPSTVGNDADGNCSSSQYCDSTTQTCHSRTPRATPFTVSPGDTHEFEFMFLASSEGFSCPSAGSDVPQQYRQDYCGQFRVETNAQTDNGTFSQGDATFYLQVSGGAGSIEVSPPDLNFEDVEPGTTDSGTFDITNTSESGSLEISSVTVSGRRNLFSVAPAGGGEPAPTTIEANSSRTWEVTLSVPEDINPEEIPNGPSDASYVEIEHGAANTQSEETVTLVVRRGSGGGPGFLADREGLSFASEASQTVSLSNTGSGTLEMSSVEFEPSALSSDYTVQIGGQTIDGNIPDDAGNLPSGESTEMTVEYNGNPNQGVGELVINHDDQVRGESTSIALLGGKSGGLGQLLPAPPELNFIGGDGGTRTFAVRNRGTGALDLSAAWQNSGAASEFSVPDIPPASGSDTRTVGAGELAKFQIEYLANDTVESQTNSFLDLPADGSVASETMTLRVTRYAPGDGGDSDPSVQLQKQFEGSSVEVGSIARFTLTSSSDVEFGSDERWFVSQRPSGSTFYNTDVGGNFAVRPDVAGTWEVAVRVLVGSASSPTEVVETQTFEATAN